jgi:hypothetical protein
VNKETKTTEVEIIWHDVVDRILEQWGPLEVLLHIHNSCARYGNEANRGDRPEEAKSWKEASELLEPVIQKLRNEKDGLSNKAHN